MMTSAPFVDAVVADANVLLSAVVGKAASRVFTDFEVGVHITEFNAAEVEEYLPRMSTKYGVPNEMAQLQWTLLPVQRHAESRYRRHFGKALADLKDTDPEDAHALALARALRLPIWSNDRHLSGLGVPCYPTAKLLRVLDTQTAPDSR